MPHIPVDVIDECLADPFYKKCCLCGSNVVQFHENLIFGGQQVKAKNCILPLCWICHPKADKIEVREKLDWIMYNRMTDEELLTYGKVLDLFARRDYLNNKYGPFEYKGTVRK